MITMDTGPKNEADKDIEPAVGLYDFLNVLKYVYNSALRHKWIVIVSVVLIVAVAFGVVKILPRTYQVSTKILVHSSSTISKLAQTGRRVDKSALTSGVAEIVKSRDNLIGIIDDLNLVEISKTKRSEVGKLKEQVMNTILGEPDEEEKNAGIREWLIDALDQKLSVFVKWPENIVFINVQWNDPWVAYEIQRVVVERFFGERRQQEMGEIDESIKLLEKQFEVAKARLNDIATKNRAMITETAALGNKRKKPSTTKRRRYRSANLSSANEEQKAEYENVSAELVSLEKEISRHKADHKKRLDAEEQKLTQYQTSYGPSHPDVVRSKKYIELLSGQDPVPAGLRKKKNSLAALLSTLEANIKKEKRGAKPNRMPLANDAEQKQVNVSDEEIAKLLFEAELTSKEFQDAEKEVNRLEGALDNARMDRDATMAAFNYRYRLTKPPVFPKAPIKPNPKKIMLASIFLAIFLGIATAVLVDVRSGVIIESWQVEKIVNIPLLGETDEI